MCFIARFCQQKYDEFVIFQSSREQQGNIGNLKEKATHFIGWHLHLFCPVFFFHRSFGVMYVVYNFIVVVQVAACGTFNVAKRYHVSAQILSFAISVQNTANMRKGYTFCFFFSYRFILCFSLNHLFSFVSSMKNM